MPLWITECVLKESETKGGNRTIMRMPHRFPHMVPDFDAQLPGKKIGVNKDDDGKGLFVFHAWQNLIPAFGHKELTVMDCNEQLLYFMQEYDYHFLSWDTNLKICNDRKCEGKNIIGYSRKAGLFNRDISIFPANAQGKIKKDAIIALNKTFYM